MTRLHAMPVAPAVAVLALVVVPLTAGCVANAPGQRRRRDDRRGVHRRRECRLSAATAPAGHAHVQREEHRRRGHRVLPARRGRPADRRRGREHRPGPHPRPRRAGRPGRLLHGLQAGHGRRRASARTSPSPTPAAPRRPRAPRRSSWPSAEAAYVAYVQRAGRATLIAGTGRSPTAYAAGDDDAARDAVRRRPRPLGAHRAGRRVVRRPRPAAGRPRGRPRPRATTWTGWHRIEKDLWPPAPEANGAAYTPLTTRQRAAAATDLSRTRSSSYDAGQRADLHVRRVPDRQRRQGAARRGRDRQGHRRGGDLVAHRPVGLPGQRRRRASRRSRASRPLPQARGPRAGRDARRRGSTRCRALLATRARIGDGLRVLRQADRRPRSRSCPTPSTRVGEPLSRLTDGRSPCAA